GHFHRVALPCKFDPGRIGAGAAGKRKRGQRGEVSKGRHVAAPRTGWRATSGSGGAESRRCFRRGYASSRQAGRMRAPLLQGSRVATPTGLSPDLKFLEKGC